MKNLPLFSHIILQPTTICNLQCRYCYLPDRDKAERMTKEVAEAISRSIKILDHPVCLVWHGGEPLAAGIKLFQELVEPFRELLNQQKIRHSIQTNGTLINQQWCDFFRKEKFQIGISLDGTEIHNSERVTVTGIPAFPKIMSGIKLLQQNNLSFSVIATINPKNVNDPFGFYEFFSSLGCSSLNINIEEREGFNRYSKGLKKRQVQNFWEKLFEAWQKNPILKIRELDMALGYIAAVLRRNDTRGNKRYARGFWPTVAYNGDLVVISPEFISVAESERQQFVVGNVLEKELHQLMRESQNIWYIKEFFEGVNNCKQFCEYYEFCGGGQASNKYFELGNIAGTETTHCQNSRKFVMDAVLKSFQNVSNKQRRDSERR